MEKVKLTQEQADEIRSLYDDLKDELSMSIDEFIDDHANDGGYKPLNDLNISVSLLAKYFYIGYEIKPEFKVGDWVYHTIGKVVRQITAISKDIEVTDGEDEYIWRKEFTRHATPEEIAEEKERRMDEKLDGILLDLNNDEKVRLQEILSNEKKKPSF